MEIGLEFRDGDYGGVSQGLRGSDTGERPEAVATRYGLRENHLWEWCGRARDGRLVLPALEDDVFGFVPVVRSVGDRAALSPPEAGTRDRDWIEIAFGEVTIRVDCATGAERIAAIVRAIGSPV